MRATFSLLGAAFIALASGVLSAGSPQKFLPVDEAARDPTFFVFRSRLIEALAAHDAGYVISILSPSIRSSFGDDSGIEEFKKRWKPEDKNSELWSALARIVSLGGKFMSDGTFQAPYISACWPEDADSFDYGAIVGENVRVREKPDAGSAVIAKLSFELVSALEFAPDRGPNSWTKIKLASGRIGYVSAQFIGHATDLRAIFEKQNGQWCMTVLVAGD